MDRFFVIAIFIANKTKLVAIHKNWCNKHTFPFCRRTANINPVIGNSCNSKGMRAAEVLDATQIGLSSYPSVTKIIFFSSMIFISFLLRFSVSLFLIIIYHRQSRKSSDFRKKFFVRLHNNSSLKLCKLPIDKKFRPRLWCTAGRSTFRKLDRKTS